MTDHSPQRTQRFTGGSTALPEWIDPRPWLPLTRSTDRRAVEAAIYSEEPGERELALMLSPAADEFLEVMAQRAQAITKRQFGRTVALYGPLYLSNYCNSGCSYCGIAADRRARRMVLAPDELQRELAAFTAKGLQEVVLLTGERVPEADVPYLRDCGQAAAEKLPAVKIEVFPMKTDEYAQLAAAGCRGVTLYQETYDEARYLEVHRWGLKRNYHGRITAPDRALLGGLRSIGIGALLGLGNPWFDMLAVYRHALYLQRRYWQADIAVSFPRLRPQLGDFASDHPVDDRTLARFIFAFRICMPQIHLVLSTREPADIRDGLAGVGISKMSVESKTTVGGYSADTADSTEQFEISDERNVPAFCAALRDRGLEPVFKNWDAAYREPACYHTAAG
jgi:2-iminoacetate synthase